MRYLSIFMFVFLRRSFIRGRAEPLTPRPLDPVAVDAFARAQARSAVVRSLVATLEASNVIVHIESSRTLPAGIGGTTQIRDEPRRLSLRADHDRLRSVARPAARPSSDMS